MYNPNAIIYRRIVLSPVEVAVTRESSGHAVWHVDHIGICNLLRLYHGSNHRENAIEAAVHKIAGIMAAQDRQPDTPA